MIDLGTLGGTDSDANAINEAGQVVGWAATSVQSDSWTPINPFLYSNGSMIDLGTFYDKNQSEAYDINEAGQVVGYSQTSSGESHAFLYSGGTMIDLGTLGGTYSEAGAINEAGQVVGSSQTSSGESHAFLYTLPTLSVTKTGLGAGTITSAPDGIDCGNDCSNAYEVGTLVTLTAIPDANSTFAGWTECTPINSTQCTVVMDAIKTVSASFAAGSIRVTAPNGGESWSIGSSQTIRWTFSGNVGTYVKIELLKANNLVTTINARAKVGKYGNGSYKWKIPKRLASGNDYTIRVTSIGDRLYSDVSDNTFTIQ